MRLQLFIPFLLAFSSLFTGASHAAHEVEKGSKIFTESDDKWTKVVSLLSPASIADKIQKGLFASNLVGIPLTANAEKVQSEAQASSNPPDSGPELRSLEALLSEETGKITRSFETVINSTVTLGIAFNDVLRSASSDGGPLNNTSFAPVLKNLGAFVAVVRDDFQARFPLPATAPGHAERVIYVPRALEQLQHVVIRLARDHGIGRGVIEHYMACINPFLHDVGVLIGDVAELYPAAIEALVLNVSALLLPEAVFLRSLVILYCFGPYVLGKDAIGEWLLQHISGALRV